MLAVLGETCFCLPTRWHGCFWLRVSTIRLAISLANYSQKFSKISKSQTHSQLSKTNEITLCLRNFPTPRCVPRSMPDYTFILSEIIIVRPKHKSPYLSARLIPMCGRSSHTTAKSCCRFAWTSHRLAYRPSNFSLSFN